MADCGCGNKLQIGFSGSKCSECSGSKGCGDVIKESPCLSKEVVDIVVDVWDDPGCDGDNVVRVFNKDECVYHDGYFYWSLEDMNVDMPPTSKWSEGSTKCEMLKPGTSLLNCNGDKLQDGTKVPNCAELAAVESKADNAIALAQTKQAQLKDCKGVDLVGGTEVLTCEGFPEAFESMLEESCLTLQDLGTQCGDIASVTAIDCGNGKYKLGIISAASSEYGTGGFDNHDTCGTTDKVWPEDPTDTTTYMTYQAANNRLGAVNGVFADLDQADQDQLTATRMFCATHTAACDETIEFFVGATVKDTDENLTSTQFVYSINGVFNTSGSLKGFASFNNKTKKFQDTVNIPVSAGPNVICVYPLRQDTGRLMTQFNVKNCNGSQSPNWRITKAGT